VIKIGFVEGYVLTRTPIQRVIWVRFLFFEIVVSQGFVTTEVGFTKKSVMSPNMTEPKLSTGIQSARKMLRHTCPSQSIFG